MLSLPPWLVRGALFPLHERLRGRRTLHELADLARLTAQPAAQVRQICAQRLRDLLCFAVAHLPFYRQRCVRHGLDLAADDLWAELAKLPVLTKPEVRANARDMLYPDVPGGLQPAVSGGTSGDTLHFHIDRRRAAQSMAARLFMQGLFGVRPGDRRVWLWGSPIELRRSLPRRGRDRLLNELVLDAFDLSTARMDAYLERIRAFRPRVIISYSSAGGLLARHAAAKCGPRHFPWLRLFVLTGDEITPEYRAQIARVFGCPAVSEYGSREVGLIAHECPRGRLHVLTPHVHVEILSAGQAAPPGRCGEVVCTNLNTRAQPLIRYRVGDVGAWSATDCDCGLPLPVMELRAARITGFLALPDGRLCSGHLADYLVRADPAVVEYRVRQPSLERIDVQLVVDERCRADPLPLLRQRFARYFGPQVRVNCTMVDRLPPDPSGKRRPIVSDVADQLARREPALLSVTEAHAGEGTAHDD